MTIPKRFPIIIQKYYFVKLILIINKNLTAFSLVKIAGIIAD